MNNVEKVCTFLQKCGTYYLATVEGNQPRVRPFGVAMVYEGKLYIQTGRAKNVSMQIAANPKVEICGFTGGKWIRVAGELVDDNRIEAKQAILDAHPNLKDMYSATDDNTQVLFLRHAEAVIAGFGGESEVLDF